MMNTVEQQIVAILQKFMSGIVAKSVIALGISKCDVDLCDMTPGDDKRLIHEITRGVELYVQGTEDQQTCLSQLSEVLGGVLNG